MGEVMGLALNDLKLESDSYEKSRTLLFYILILHSCSEQDRHAHTLTQSYDVAMVASWTLGFGETMVA